MVCSHGTPGNVSLLCDTVVFGGFETRLLLIRVFFELCPFFGSVYVVGWVVFLRSCSKSTAFVGDVGLVWCYLLVPPPTVCSKSELDNGPM